MEYAYQRHKGIYSNQEMPVHLQSYEEHSKREGISNIPRVVFLPEFLS